MMKMNIPIKQTVLAALISGCSMISIAQSLKDDVPKGWHLKDQQKDGYYGISLDKAYELVKNKKSKTVVVAVIDSGIDTLHEDLCMDGTFWAARTARAM
jgi:hypothetical protein